MSLRRSIAALALVVLLTAAVAPPAYAAYAGNCDSGNSGSTSYHGYLQRTRPGVDNTYFISVISEFTVRALDICNPGQNYDANFFVPAASIQSSQGLVQIGYGKCYSDGATPGTACGVSPTYLADGKLHFLFTPDDLSFGNLGDASALAQYNKTPIVGHTYRVRIRAINTQTDGSGDWEYCIRDVGIGEAYKCWHNDRHWNSSKLVWWGYETGNSNSQLGSKLVDPEIRMRWMQYQFRNGSTVDPNWYVVTNLSTTDCLYVVPDVGDPWPSWYHCDVVSTVDVDGDGLVNDYETLYGHTHDHSPP